MVDTRHMMALPSRRIVCLSLCVLLNPAFFCNGQDSRRSDAIHFFHFDGQQPPSKELRLLLQHEVMWDDSGQDFLNPSGLHLVFEKIGEQATPDGRVASRFRVSAPGAPEDKVFALETWPVDKEVIVDPTDIYLNGQGLLMIHRPKPEQELSFKAPGDEFEIAPAAQSAEPIRYLLSSKDGQLMIFGTLVPHPVTADDHGCGLEVRIAQSEPLTFLIIAHGFPAKARIPLVLQSEGSVASEMLVTDANGHAVMAGIPSVQGKAQGTFKAAAEGPGCLPSIVMPWSADPNAAPEKTPEKTRKR
jgi:hypothetical protein